MENLGRCYYCKEPVLAGAGQIVKGLVKSTVSPLGEVEEQEYPTHKRCRKENE